MRQQLQIIGAEVARKGRRPDQLDAVIKISCIPCSRLS